MLHKKKEQNEIQYLNGTRVCKRDPWAPLGKTGASPRHICRGNVLKRLKNEYKHIHMNDNTIT